MERWNNRVAVVTGASVGIGKAITFDLVKAGMRVVALARRLDRLEQNRQELPKKQQALFYTRKLDVTNEEDVKETFAWIDKTLGGTDILVNNAGILRFGNLVDGDTKVFNEVINTNINGLVYATQAAYKSMTERSVAGHIIHINSWIGHRVIDLSTMPSFNIYSPTKFAVTAINDTLRNELRNLRTGIKTTSISPGAVKTELLPQEMYTNGPLILSPEDVSQAVLFAIATPEHVQIHEITIKALEDAC